jgi:CheY-like chemotaxis protein
VLSGRDGDYLADSQNTEQFIAPTAYVLLVDDIETNLKVGAGLLKLYGIRIDTCLSGKAAIEAVLANNYDLVLMDHMMPEMDGVEAVKIIRALGGKHADLPIVALTANAIIGAKEMFLQNGFNDFISKPIEVSKLNSVLSKWLPSEKQIKAEPPTEPATSEDAEIEIVITGVDVKRGIALSGGGARDYLDTLSIYHKNGVTKLAEVAQCLESENLQLYTTYVHALKSASANIGANKISKEASALETAGINKDIDFIKTHTKDFLANLQKLLEGINATIAANSQKPEGEADESTMYALLAELKTAMEAFDADAIDEISEKLQDFTHLPDKGELLSDILQNVFVSQYKVALGQIEELL